MRMFRFFDGVPRLIVPDNLKSGVNRACFYDPEINRGYANDGVALWRRRPAAVRRRRPGKG